MNALDYYLWECQLINALFIIIKIKLNKKTIKIKEKTNFQLLDL